MQEQPTVTISIGPLSLAEVVAVARNDAPVRIAEESIAAMAASREFVEALACSGKPVYGISTGFGALATTFIDP